MYFNVLPSQINFNINRQGYFEGSFKPICLNDNKASAFPIASLTGLWSWRVLRYSFFHSEFKPISIFIPQYKSPILLPEEPKGFLPIKFSARADEILISRLRKALKVVRYKKLFPFTTVSRT
jgi:hypothetical protein